MEHVKKQLIQEAQKSFSNIRPCSSKGSFQDCFSVEGDSLLFWFNTPDNSTHIMTADLA
ncbi:hypothetical protein [Chitinivibrio alkaliphilus]|uniref:hypothetical protein n=1 Tax=Chitinivibrio alkaliphilus TaxID=1505232 RepID=UPI000426087C|nr:hypothetical protein [Chitinivibrio alkaliphilus]